MSLIITPDKPKDLTGCILALNLENCKKFQCGGFWLNTNKPWAVVEPGAQQYRLHEALLDGRLLDVTDQSVKGLETKEGAHTAPKEAEDGNTVYIQVDSKGNVLVIAPKDKSEEEKFGKELKEKGTISTDNHQLADHGLGGEGKVTSGQASDILNNMANKLDNTKSKYYKSNIK